MPQRRRHSRTHDGVTITSPEDVVERAEAYMRALAPMPVPLSTLSRIVGLSERGLRNAFYRVRGMSPKRCMRAERLEGVRRALSHSSLSTVTVTSVATAYGFYELGRFAASYREAFGEAPSDTLRRTGRTSSYSTVDHKGETRCLATHVNSR